MALPEMSSERAQAPRLSDERLAAIVSAFWLDPEDAFADHHESYDVLLDLRDARAEKAQLQLDCGAAEASVATLNLEADEYRAEIARFKAVRAGESGCAVAPQYTSPARGPLQYCEHTDAETYTGGWRCRVCGYSWAVQP